MTIAIDVRTGAVVGQVVGWTPPTEENRNPRSSDSLMLLTREGYKTVPALSVRLEELS